MFVKFYFITSTEITITDNISSGDTGTISNLKPLRCKFPRNIIISYLNINSIRNKFDALGSFVGNLIDVLTISETKLDSSFPTAQFQINGFKAPL